MPGACVHVCDFSTLVLAITCPNTIRRVFYRFTYSSMTNVISAFAAYVLYDPAASTSRITIEWNDLAIAASSASTISRMRTSIALRENHVSSEIGGYLVDQPLQFLRNNIASDVSALVPSKLVSLACMPITVSCLSSFQWTLYRCYPADRSVQTDYHLALLRSTAAEHHATMPRSQVCSSSLHMRLARSTNSILSQAQSLSLSERFLRSRIARVIGSERHRLAHSDSVSDDNESTPSRRQFAI